MLSMSSEAVRIVPNFSEYLQCHAELPKSPIPGSHEAQVSSYVPLISSKVTLVVFVRLRETSVEIGNFAEFWMPTSARFQTVWECYKNFQTSGKFGDF